MESTRRHFSGRAAATPRRAPSRWRCHQRRHADGQIRPVAFRQRQQFRVAPQIVRTSRDIFAGKGLLRERPCRISLRAAPGNPRKSSSADCPNRDDIPDNGGKMFAHVLTLSGGCARLCAPKKMPHSGLGERGKNLFHELHVPREPGGNWHLATSLKPLIRLSWRRRARNPSATLHEDRFTPFRGVTSVS